MKRNAKRLCSLLLSLVMLVSLFGGTGLTAQAQGETITVYLDLGTSGWGQSLVYWWDSAETVNWPGISMNWVEGTIFTAEIPADARGVVFNDGNGMQSTDLHDPKDGDLFVVGTDDWFEAACNHEYMDGICIHCGEAEPVPVEECTVYFDLSVTVWEQVYIYWWRNNDTIGSWPGLLMTQAGGTVYSAQVPGDVKGLLFTDGSGNQTGDLELPGDGYIYDPTCNQWAVYEGCDHEWDAGRADTEPTCTEPGQKICTCLLCGETKTVEILPLGHDWVDGICSRCGEAEPVPVAEYTVYFDLGITDWEQVYFYWWRDGDDIGPWPGVLMTHKGGSVYSAQIPENVNGLLFTNGDGDQTEDLELPGDGYIYSKAAKEWKEHNGCSHVWDDGTMEKEPTCVERGAELYTCELCGETMTIEVCPYGHNWVDGICSRCGWNQNELCTIYFDMGFSNRRYVNIYWWADGEDSPAWPGVPMTYEGGSIYSAQIPSYATGVLFNDVGFKDPVGNTPDMELPGDGYVYRETLGQWALHSGCNHAWDGGEVLKRADCEENGIYIYTCANCDETVEKEIPAFGHSFVEGYCTTCGAEDPTLMYTVYYDIAFSERENVNIYWWADGETIGAWPGLPMTHEGGSIYSALVPAYATGLLFNDGETQTANLTLPGDGYVYRENQDEWVVHNYCYHEWKDGVCDLCGEGKTEEPVGMYTVYFDNTFVQFHQVYVVYLVDNNPHKEEMTQVSTNIYSSSVPKGLRLEFVDGEGACIETLAPGDNYLYTKDGVWIPYNGCAHEWDRGVKQKVPTCMENGAWVFTCAACDQTFEVILEITGHDWINGICSVCGMVIENTVTVYLDVQASTEEEVRVYWWGTPYTMDWPGMQMTHEGGTVYSADIPEGIEGLVFSAGERQTDDLTLPWLGGGCLYLMKGTCWVKYCAHEYHGAVCIHCGKISTGFVEKEDGRYYYQDGVVSEATGLVKYDGAWWYIVKGKLAADMTSLVKYNNEWWYVVNGKVASDMTTLVKYNNEWWYVVKGKIASNTTSLVKYNNEWWYVVKGKIASKTTSLVKYNNEWWYVVNGKIASKTTTLVKYNNEWWYVVKGKIASKTTTLVQYNGGWYYLVKGKLAAKTTTLVQYNGGWYYVNKGSVDWSYTGNFTYNGGTYRIVKGRVA